MVGVMTLYRTTIGRKVIMAVTGLIGIGFVMFHMYGNLKAFPFMGGAAYFNEYAEGLRSLGQPIFGHTHLLWVARLVLIVSVGLHVWAAWTLYQDSRQARNIRYTRHTKIQADLAALYIRVGGAILLIFIIFHLAQFTWGIPGIHPSFIPGDAYHNLVAGLKSYAYLPAIFYLIAMVVLGFHMVHGCWSLFQTLGLNNQTYSKPLRALSWAITLITVIGFSIVPIAVILGIIR